MPFLHMTALHAVMHTCMGMSDEALDFSTSVLLKAPAEIGLKLAVTSMLAPPWTSTGELVMLNGACAPSHWSLAASLLMFFTIKWVVLVVPTAVRGQTKLS